MFNYLKKILFSVLILVMPCINSASKAMNCDERNDPPRIMRQQRPQAVSVPIGAVIQFSGTDAPEGWLMCDGKHYSNQIHPQLYEIIKEQYVPMSSWIIQANKNSTIEKFFCVPDMLSTERQNERQSSSVQSNVPVERKRFVLPDQNLPAPSLTSVFYPLNHIIKY